MRTSPGGICVRATLAFVVVVCLGAAGCDCGGDGAPPTMDAGRDAGGAAAEGGVDAGGRDAGAPVPDGGSDAGAAATDASVDAGPPATDGGFDAGVDAGTDAGVDAGLDAGVDAGFDAGVDAGPAVVSCQTLFEGGTTTSGVYTLRTPDMGSFSAYCDMTTLGGGWTLVASYPIGSPAVPTGWAASAAMGSAYTSTTDLFKLSDATIRALASHVYRLRGRSTMCQTGACSIDQTLFWGPTCAYDSTARSTACSQAYLDVGLTMSTPAAMSGGGPCSWHWGLVDTQCGVLSGTITSHDPGYGISVCVGELTTFTHGCQGRGAETAGIEIWAR